MPIAFPEFSDIVARTRADVQATLPDLDPTLENSLIDAIVTSHASRIADVYADLARAIRERFPQTATGESLDDLGEVFGVTRLAATKASGTAVLPGTAGTAIPAGTLFNAASGRVYASTASASIGAVSLSVAILTRSGTTATATFAAPHGMASGLTVAIAGADQADYNGAFVVTALSETELQYSVSGSPATPATGSITASATIASVPVEAQETGASGNLASGARLSLATTIAGAGAQAFVTFLGVTGGSDIETDARFSPRIIDKRASLVALFSAPAIRQQAQTVPGVTRVLVKEVTPNPGQTTVYFLREDDEGSAIPDAGEVATVKTKLLEIKPAHMVDDDLIVAAPTPLAATFVFTALSPDTPELRAAIESNLAALFREQVDIEQVVSEDKYRGVISTTIDPASGRGVDSFTLSSPVGALDPGAGGIVVYGGSSFV